MQRKQIEELLEKYTSDLATTEERALVESWYVKHPPILNQLPDGQLEHDQKQSLDTFLHAIKHHRVRKLWRSLAAAASLLVFFSAAGYYLHVSNRVKPTLYTLQHNKKADLPPGSNKATLTLSNGNVIVLNGAKNGTLASQGNTMIHKAGEGVISYAGAKEQKQSDLMIYNTAATPRGGQYQLVLSDGTKVWLNAASSLKFPVAFLGNERKVELTGEAYFEVVHDAAKPFRVVSNGQTVEDIGTHFNINAYGDETASRTTLIEGSIRISTRGQNRIIKPGEQARIEKGHLNIVDADVEEAVAWKNGYFHFDNSTIQEVARQLSRWYDVDITYEGQPTPRLFSGEISKNVNASQLMDILSFKKIHYRIEKKAIVILP